MYVYSVLYIIGPSIIRQLSKLSKKIQHLAKNKLTYDFWLWCSM